MYNQSTVSHILIVPIYSNSPNIIPATPTTSRRVAPSTTSSLGYLITLTTRLFRTGEKSQTRLGEKKSDRIKVSFGEIRAD